MMKPAEPNRNQPTDHHRWPKWEKSQYQVSFPDSDKPSLTLPAGTNLSEALTAVNSPVLFGCRTGLCGTCLVRVVAKNGPPLPPPDQGEREILEVMADGIPNARLACQIEIQSDLCIQTIDEDEA